MPGTVPLPVRPAMEYPRPPTLPPEQRMPGQYVQELRQEVADLLNRKGTRSFPGAQPISFAREHLQELQQRDYYVCEKSDGIRCLMYLTAENTAQGPKETAYLIDRKNDYYQVPNLHFPRPEDNQAFYTNTILDGELVNDREQDGRIQQRYIVFDCLICDGQSLIGRPLDKRLAYFHERIFKPYERLFFKQYPEELEHQPFHIAEKKMELGYGTEMMFRQVLLNLKHGNDGLIFTCRETPYQFGTDPNILKWKPSDENSIDFKLILDISMYYPCEEGNGEPFPDYDAMPTFKLFISDDGDRDIFHGTMTVAEDEWEKLKALNEPLNERIVECNFDREKWRFMRFRDDKKGANHKSTVEKVLQSIRDPVTREDLIAVALPAKKAWKMRHGQVQSGPAGPAQGQEPR